MLRRGIHLAPDKYGVNSFKLHGLPMPRPGQVLGILGTNGATYHAC